jgi:hypothetical protein
MPRRGTGLTSGARSRVTPPLDAAPLQDREPMVADAQAPLRLLIVSDAWAPQVNGVVRTLSTVSDLLRGAGDTVEVIGL